MGLKNEFCEINCDEKYCDSCHAGMASDNSNERREIEYIIAKARWESVIRQVSEIYRLLWQAYKQEREARQRYNSAKRNRQSKTRRIYEDSVVGAGKGVSLYCLWSWVRLVCFKRMAKAQPQGGREKAGCDCGDKSCIK